MKWFWAKDIKIEKVVIVPKEETKEDVVEEDVVEEESEEEIEEDIILKIKLDIEKKPDSQIMYFTIPADIPDSTYTNFEFSLLFENGITITNGQDNSRNPAIVLSRGRWCLNQFIVDIQTTFGIVNKKFCYSIEEQGYGDEMMYGIKFYITSDSGKSVKQFKVDIQWLDIIPKMALLRCSNIPFKIGSYDVRSYRIR